MYKGILTKREIVSLEIRKMNKAAEENLLKIMITNINENSVYSRSLCVQTKIIKKIKLSGPFL